MDRCIIMQENQFSFHESVAAHDESHPAIILKYFHRRLQSTSVFTWQIQDE